MADPRYDRLAANLVGYSCAVTPGDNVLIEVFDTPERMSRALVRAVAAAGGRPFLTLKSNALMRDLFLAASEEQMRLCGQIEAYRLEHMQAYIGVRGHPNVSEWGDVPSDKMNLYRRHWWGSAHMDVRVNNTRWVVLRWPSPSFAQQAQMSSEAFEDFFFDVCNLDYAHMSRAMEPLRVLMEATDRVRLLAPGTDVSFSIKGIPAVSCDGRNNIPDGEVFTAPVRNSVEGRIQFNTPTLYQGVTHEDVCLHFRQGRIVEASSSNDEHLETLLDSDEGARYVGEFAIGFNPHITRPMRDILFDEKIAGSIHLTPGKAYEDADNGNRSNIHWDLVLRMTPEVGGGEIYFDERLIRKDGRFVLPELEGLNPENLVSPDAVAPSPVPSE